MLLSQAIEKVIFGIGHVSWLAKLMARPSMVALTQKPVFEANGQPRGITAFFEVISSLYISLCWTNGAKVMGT